MSKFSVEVEAGLEKNSVCSVFKVIPDVASDVCIVETEAVSTSKLSVVVEAGLEEDSVCSVLEVIADVASDSFIVSTSKFSVVVEAGLEEDSVCPKTSVLEVISDVASDVCIVETDVVSMSKLSVMVEPGPEEDCVCPKSSVLEVIADVASDVCTVETDVVSPSKISVDVKARLEESVSVVSVGVNNSVCSKSLVVEEIAGVDSDANIVEVNVVSMFVKVGPRVVSGDVDNPLALEVSNACTVEGDAASDVVESVVSVCSRGVSVLAIIVDVVSNIFVVVLDAEVEETGNVVSADIVVNGESVVKPRPSVLEEISGVTSNPCVVVDDVEEGMATVLSASVELSEPGVASWDVCVVPSGALVSTGVVVDEALP
jgi:hypothetical protein